jgi:hypothetical protein
MKSVSSNKAVPVGNTTLETIKENTSDFSKKADLITWMVVS